MKGLKMAINIGSIESKNCGVDVRINDTDISFRCSKCGFDDVTAGNIEIKNGIMSETEMRCNSCGDVSELEQIK